MEQQNLSLTDGQVLEVGGIVSVSRRSRLMRRLLFVVVTANVLGILCFSLATNGQDALSKQSVDLTADASLLDSLAFTLMLPGIFFASIAFLCAPLFAWSEGMVRAVWYGGAFAINLFAAWKGGTAFESARASEENE